MDPLMDTMLKLGICDERLLILVSVIQHLLKDHPDQRVRSTAYSFIHEILAEVPLMVPRPSRTPLTIVDSRYLGNSLLIGALPQLSLELLQAFEVKVIVICTDDRLERRVIPTGCDVFVFPATFAGSSTITTINSYV